ncbi:MAG: hypothetical protein LBQ00_03440 [Syntrophobacterales bacterium]|jgi:hypothetical protein|nr:hypothetical protein [Syntrophobacterales bacterium]
MMDDETKKAGEEFTKIDSETKVLLERIAGYAGQEIYTEAQTQAKEVREKIAPKGKFPPQAGNLYSNVPRRPYTAPLTGTGEGSGNTTFLGE